MKVKNKKQVNKKTKKVINKSNKGIDVYVAKDINDLFLKLGI